MSDRQQIAKVAALSRWSREDGVAGTEPARRAFRESFRQQVIAAAEAHGEKLTEVETEKRAERLRRAYYINLSRRSAQVRAARKRQRQITYSHETSGRQE